MNPISFKRHRFPPDSIRLGIWLNYRFTLSLRDVEDLLAERGIDVTCETIRCWANRFGPTMGAKNAEFQVAGAGSALRLRPLCDLQQLQYRTSSHLTKDHATLPIFRHGRVVGRVRRGRMKVLIRVSAHPAEVNVTRVIRLCDSLSSSCPAGMQPVGITVHDARSG